MAIGILHQLLDFAVILLLLRRVLGQILRILLVDALDLSVETLARSVVNLDKVLGRLSLLRKLLLFPVGQLGFASTNSTSDQTNLSWNSERSEGGNDDTGS